MLYKESRDYKCKVADNADGAKELIEAGSKYVCEFENKRLFRKPKQEVARSPVRVFVQVCGVVV